MGKMHGRINVTALICVEDINLATSTLSSCTCSFEGLQNKRIANVVLRCGRPKKNLGGCVACKDYCGHAPIMKGLSTNPLGSFKYCI